MQEKKPLDQMRYPKALKIIKSAKDKRAEKTRKKKQYVTRRATRLGDFPVGD